MIRRAGKPRFPRAFVRPTRGAKRPKIFIFTAILRLRSDLAAPISGGAVSELNPKLEEPYSTAVREEEPCRR